MISTPDTEKLRRLRAFLDENGYDAEHLAERLGSAAPPRPENLPTALHRTREANAANALARLFLIGASLEESLANDTLPTAQLDLAKQRVLLTEFNLLSMLTQL